MVVSLGEWVGWWNFTISPHIVETVHRSFRTSLKADSKWSDSTITMSISNCELRPTVEPPPAHYLSPAQSQPSFQQNDINFLPITATIEEVQSPVRPVLLNVCDSLIGLIVLRSYISPIRLQVLPHDRLSRRTTMVHSTLSKYNMGKHNRY